MLLLVHLGLVQRHGMSSPPWIQGLNMPQMKFFPNFFLRELMAWYAALGVLGSLAALFPWELGEKADPFAPAPAGKKLGVALLGCALMPDYPLELAVLGLMGVANICFIATANTTLQLSSTPEMRGRVMALYGVAFLGTTPIGGPLVGWISQHAGPRFGLALGGIASVLAALVALPSLTSLRPLRRRRGPESVPVPNPEEAIPAL